MDCWNVPPEPMTENVAALSIWALLGSQWNIAGFGGIIGWGGYGPAIDMLIHGYRLNGMELLAEVDRLRLCEAAQLEIESARHKREEQKRKKNKPHEDETGTKTKGDLTDFYDEEAP